MLSTLCNMSLGKTIDTSASSFVQPYFGFALLAQKVSGADIHSGDATMGSNLDGYQVQANTGINWQINKQNVVFAEIGTGAGNKFKNTFTAGAGYRYQF